MPDTTPSDSESAPPATSVTPASGGVNIDAQRDVIAHGDIVGRDKITTIGYTVEQVNSLLTQINSTFQPKPFDGRCPYLGLNAFSEDDADRFFGRETLVDQLVARVKESHFVVIAGPSGSGKSSLVRAGLIHALKQGALPNSDRWLYATLTPGRDPIDSLALAMSRLAKSPDAGKYVREHSAEPSALHEFAESQLSDRKDQRAVIFVDQFEEVFTQVSKEDERLAFLNLLTNAATIEGRRVTVLFALRSDFVSNCATYPQLNVLINQEFMQVGRMEPDELVNAIARPAKQVRLRIDLDLVAQIVNDMQNEPGALPLMQFALKDLFDAQQAKGGVIALTLNDYLERGGLRQALERHADAAFAKLSESEQQLAHTIFSSLIGIGHGTQDTRRTATLNELVPANVEGTQVEAVIQKLADARLITTDEQAHRVTVTIAHEALIGAWPWLQKLINDNRETIALQQRIVEDAQEWNEQQRDASYLYSGARLATAREELVGQKIVLSELAQRFVTASIEAEESAVQREKARQQQEIRRLRVRNRIVTVAGIAASVTAIMAILFGIRAEQQTRTAVYRQLAAQTTARLSDNFNLALLLSVETARLGRRIGDSYGYESLDSLLRALESNARVAGFLFGHSNSVTSVAFSPNGKTMASGSYDGSIILWDVVTHQRLGVPLTGHTFYVTSLAFSPDGKTLASGSADKGIILWDVATHQPLGSLLTGPTDPVLSIAFSPDGKMLASGSDDGSIILWDVVTHQRLGVPLTGHPTAVNSVAFSLDGKTLASGSSDKNIMLWDVATRQPLGEPLIGHSGAVSNVAFSPNGITLASSSSDESIILWEVATRQPLGEPLIGHSGAVNSVAFSPDGKTLASGSDDQSIILWDVTTHQSLGGPLTGRFDKVWSVAFSPDSKMLASGSCGKNSFPVCAVGSIILWNVETYQRLSEPVFSNHDNAGSVTLSPDGTTLTLGSSGKSFTFWDVVARQRLNEFLTDITDQVVSVAFSPDGKMLALSGFDFKIFFRDATTRQPLGEPFTGHKFYVTSMAFSPDGKTLASGSGSGDKTIILWDVTNPQAPKPIGQPLTGHTADVSSMAFSPDGKTLASGSADKTIILWDVATRQPLGEPLIGHSDTVRSVAFSLDGKSLASRSDNQEIFLWDVDPQSWIARSCQMAGRNLMRAEYTQYINPDPDAYDNDYTKNPTCPGLLVEPVAKPVATATP